MSVGCIPAGQGIDYIQGSTYLVLGISGNVIMLLYAQIENFLTVEVIRVY